jgi:hypothetical protein
MDDDVPISELCKPLSAKIMPRSALFDRYNTPRDNDEAFAEGRHSETKRMIERIKWRKK